MEFLTWRKHSVGNSTLNSTVCGLKYYFRKVVNQPQRVVTIPTPARPSQIGELLTTSELRQLFAAAISPKHRLVLSLNVDPATLPDKKPRAERIRDLLEKQIGHPISDCPDCGAKDSLLRILLPPNARAPPGCLID